MYSHRHVFTLKNVIPVGMPGVGGVKPVHGTHAWTPFSVQAFVRIGSEEVLLLEVNGREIKPPEMYCTSQ